MAEETNAGVTLLVAEVADLCVVSGLMELLYEPVLSPGDRQSHLVLCLKLAIIRRIICESILSHELLIRFMYVQAGASVFIVNI